MLGWPVIFASRHHTLCSLSWKGLLSNNVFLRSWFFVTFLRGPNFSTIGGCGIVSWRYAHLTKTTSYAEIPCLWCGSLLLTLEDIMETGVGEISTATDHSHQRETPPYASGWSVTCTSACVQSPVGQLRYPGASQWYLRYNPVLAFHKVSELVGGGPHFSLCNTVERLWSWLC